MMRGRANTEAFPHMTKTNSASVSGAAGQGGAPRRRSGFPGPSLLPHLAAGAAFSILAFLLYFATRPEGPVPGVPADTLERIAGLRPDLMPRFVVWRRAFSFFLSLCPLPLSAASAAFCAAFSALGVGAAYLAVSQFVLMLFDRGLWSHELRRDPSGAATALAAIGGSGAAVALATSAPYWTTATQAYPYAFHLAWFFFALFFLFRFAMSRARAPLLAFALLYGAGLGQTSVFLGCFPLAFGLFGFVVLASEKRPALLIAGTLALAGAVAAAVLLYNAADHAAAVSAYGTRETVLHAAKTLATALSNGVSGSIPRAWWLILLGLTVLPWLACLVVAKRGVNAEPGVALSCLHAAAGLTVACVLLDLRFSPWKFYNVESLQIVPYAMTAMSFGYLVVVLAARFLRRSGDENPSVARKARSAAAAAACLVPLCGAVALVRNADDADPRASAAVFRYVDAVLDGMQGREWLVTPGLLDSNIRVRAAERGLGVKIVSVAQDSARGSSEELSRLLPDVALRNAANIGPVALLREWIARRPDAGAELALSVLPDFWHLGPFEDVPSGPVFLGVPADSAEGPDLDAAAAAARGLLDALEPELARVGDDATPRMRFYAAFVRQRASHAANNVAFLLERAKRSEDAWALYARTAAFDPDNVSCILNRAALFRKGLHPEASAEIEAEMAGLQAKLAASKIDIRSNLASSFGYVSSPSAFLDLGWRWAMSGMSTLALNSLHRAAEAAGVEHQGTIRGLIADIYRQSGDLEASESAYLSVLAEDPGVPDALIGLVRICVMRGDFEGARRHLDQARAAGVPQERLLFETAAMDLAAGDVEQATVAVQRLMDFNPDSREALALMALVHTAAFEKAKDDKAERKSALDALHGVVAELARAAGEDDFLTRFVRGRAEALEGKYADARDDFVFALRNARGGDRLTVLGSVMQLDFALADRASAEVHAKAALTIDPDHPFANYILGSIMLGREQYASAEAYLARALSGSQDYIPALNDIAMAQISLGKFDKAEENARRALSLRRDFYGAWDTLGLVLLAKGDASAASSAFETALQLEENDPRVVLHAAMALAELGDVQSARARVGELYAAAKTFSGQDARDFEALRRKIGK